MQHTACQCIIAAIEPCNILQVIRRHTAGVIASLWNHTLAFICANTNQSLLSLFHISFTDYWDAISPDGDVTYIMGPDSAKLNSNVNPVLSLRCHLFYVAGTTGMQSPPMEMLLTIGPDGVSPVLSLFCHFSSISETSGMQSPPIET